MLSHPVTALSLGAVGTLFGALTTVHTGDVSLGLLWQVIGCMGGAMTSLWFQPWKNMLWAERGFSFLVAMFFSFFVTPIFFQIDGSRESGGRFYVMATAAFVLIPFLIKKLKINIGGAKLSEDDE